MSVTKQTLFKRQPASNAKQLLKEKKAQELSNSITLDI